MFDAFFSTECIDDFPENGDDLVVAVDVEGYTYLAHCRNRNWYCAITGRSILTPINTWILMEPADHRSSTPEARRALARDVKEYCL